LHALGVFALLFISFVYFAKYSLIAAAAFLPSPIGRTLARAYQVSGLRPKLARSGRICITIY